MPPTVSSAPAAPTCTCRACGQSMDAKYQPGLIAARPGHFIVTCWNPDCWMQKYTFTDVSYPTVDLAAYRPAAVPSV